MEDRSSLVIRFSAAALSAALVAFILGYVGHYDFGLSRVEIRHSALIATALIASLLALEIFKSYWNKPK